MFMLGPFSTAMRGGAMPPPITSPRAGPMAYRAGTSSPSWQAVQEAMKPPGAGGRGSTRLAQARPAIRAARATAAMRSIGTAELLERAAAALEQAERTDDDRDQEHRHREQRDIGAEADPRERERHEEDVRRDGQ